MISNLNRAPDAGLSGGLCEPPGLDAGAETVNAAVRCLHAPVMCSEFDLADRTIPVFVAFESLSPNTGRIDRVSKVHKYAAVPSIRRYVIPASTSVGVTVLEPSEPNEAWRKTVPTGDDILRLREIAIEHPSRNSASTSRFRKTAKPRGGGAIDDRDKARTHAACQALIAIETGRPPDPTVPLRPGRAPPTPAPTAARGPDGPTRRRLH